MPVRANLEAPKVTSGCPLRRRPEVEPVRISWGLGEPSSRGISRRNSIRAPVMLMATRLAMLSSGPSRKL